MCDSRRPANGADSEATFRVLIEDSDGGRWEPTVMAADTAEAKRLAVARAIEQGHPWPSVLRVTAA